MNSENFTVDIKVNSTDAENKLKNLEALSQILEKKLNIDVGLNIDVEALNKKAENFVNNFENGIKNIFGLDDEKVANFNKRVDEINKAYQPKLQPYTDFLTKLETGINNIAGAIEKEVEIAKKNQSDKEKINLSKTIAKETKETKEEQQEDKKVTQTSKTSTTEKAVISEVARGVGVPNSINSLANGESVTSSGIIGDVIDGLFSLATFMGNLNIKVADKLTPIIASAENMVINPLREYSFNVALARQGANSGAGKQVLSEVYGAEVAYQNKSNKQVANLFHILGVNPIDKKTGQLTNPIELTEDILKNLYKLSNSQQQFLLSQLPAFKSNLPFLKSAYEEHKLNNKNFEAIDKRDNFNNKAIAKTKEIKKLKEYISEDKTAIVNSSDWSERTEATKRLAGDKLQLNTLFNGGKEKHKIEQQKEFNNSIMPFYLHSNESKTEHLNELKDVIKDLKNALIKFGKAESNTHYHNTIHIHGATFKIDEVHNKDDLKREIANEINGQEILQMYTKNFTRKA